MAGAARDGPLPTGNQASAPGRRLLYSVRGDNVVGECQLTGAGEGKRKGEPARVRNGSAQRAAGAAVTSRKGLRLLIVEDVAAEAELAVRHLASGGIPCVPRTVADERQFRAALKLFRPHVILSDFTLPR